MRIHADSENNFNCFLVGKKAAHFLWKRDLLPFGIKQLLPS
jgi:hypothetical protein